MITALALVCLYAEPTNCSVYVSQGFYPTEEVCRIDRINAEQALNTVTQGVAAYKCIEWGKPT